MTHRERHNYDHRVKAQIIAADNPNLFSNSWCIRATLLSLWPMEELLIAILTGGIEFIVQVIAYFPWDILFWNYRERRGPPEFKGDSVVPAVLVGLALGGVLGGVSLLVRRQTMLPYPWLRISNVLVAPLVSGFLARQVAGRRQRRGLNSNPRLHFAFALAITLALVLVRFIYAVRPG